MFDAKTANDLMVGTVPITRLLGLRVAATTPEQVELALPDDPRLLNHVQTVHAAAQFGLGENASAVMAIGAFPEFQRPDVLLLTSGATIRYVAPAKGPLRAVATLPATEQARVRQEFAASGRADFVVAVEVRANDGATTATMNVTWALRARLPPQQSQHGT